MARLDTDRQNELEPKRMQYAEQELVKLGYSLLVYNNRIDFFHNGEKCSIFPYSGWHTGKTIVDGRGIEKLLSQLKNKTP